MKILPMCCLVASSAAFAATPHPPPGDDELLRAIDQGSGARVELLLKEGANANARDERGEPALLFAMHSDHFDIAKTLADWPSTDLEAENKDGQTALMVAAYNGRVELVNDLIERGAEVSHSGWTALHFAASNGQAEVVQILLDHSAYVDAASPNGTTPLMMAARHKDRSICQTLVKAGADPTPRNQAGLDAADFAKKAGDEELAVWLGQAATAYRHAHPSLFQAPAAPPASSAPQ